MLRSIKSLRWSLAVLALGLALGAAALLRGGTEPPPGVAPRPDRESPRERRPERREVGPAQRAAGPVAMSASGFFAAVPGEEFRYDLSARWLATTELLLSDDPQAPAWKLGGQIPPRVTTDIAGTLRVAIADRQEGEILVRFSLDGANVRVRAGGGNLPFDAAQLARSALVRLTDDGRIVGYAFEPEVPADSRTLLVALFASSQQFVARDSAEPWTVSGLHDDVGAFIARFEWRSRGEARSDGGSPTIRRTIVKYDSSSGQAIEKSSSEATFGGGWITAADVAEERSAEIEGLLRARTTLRLRTKLIEHVTVATTPIGDASEKLDWALHFAAAPEANDPAASPSGQPVADAIERLGETLDRLKDLAAEGGLSGPEGFELWSEIADLVRRAPDDTIPGLVELLRSGEIPTGMQNWIASALGKAGGEGAAAAAAALAGLVADPSVSADTRLAALVAAHQLGASVTPELLGAAADLLLGAPGSEMDAALANAAALLLGSQAGNAQLAGDQVELALAALELTREVAFERGEPQVYLDALLNSGRDDLLEQAIGYMSDADELVRLAAAEALAAQSNDPRVIDALLKKLGGDDAPAVRSAAIDSLASAEPSPAATRLLVEIALGEADPGLRSRAVSALGEYAARGSSDARDGLTRIGDPANGPVAEQARRALGEVS